MDPIVSPVFCMWEDSHHLPCHFINPFIDSIVQATMLKVKNTLKGKINGTAAPPGKSKIQVSKMYN